MTLPTSTLATPIIKTSAFEPTSKIIINYTVIPPLNDSRLITPSPIANISSTSPKHHVIIHRDRIEEQVRYDLLWENDKINDPAIKLYLDNIINRRLANFLDINDTVYGTKVVNCFSDLLHDLTVILTGRISTEEDFTSSKRLTDKVVSYYAKLKTHKSIDYGYVHLKVLNDAYKTRHLNTTTNTLSAFNPQTLYKHLSDTIKDERLHVFLKNFNVAPHLANLTLGSRNELTHMKLVDNLANNILSKNIPKDPVKVIEILRYLFSMRNVFERSPLVKVMQQALYEKLNLCEAYISISVDLSHF
ncbi:hypothetical protein SGGMMB4_03444 [Sodalis glossinidius str. 'morsitans']|uniref:Uncharacterized protein n=2 Tax=Sodalis glossinidius TaxID=63612 RepID=A0A193QK99_SODGM|nr:hypothetical protein [Sodalis glossinidius]CRL45596.1 hypothetical protein SGGMMB4_03444 [Sodalis glossinidius str. 'morsitans']